MTKSSIRASEKALRAAYDLRLLVSRLRRKLKEAYDNLDLTPSQISVISRLSHDGPASTSDLAAAEGVRRQSMAAIVMALEEQGMVRREPDAADRRRQLIVLSHDAVEMLQGSRRLRDEWLAVVLEAHCTGHELNVVAEALTILRRLT